MKAVGELLGLAFVVAGIAAIYWPAAIIALGLGLVLWGMGGNDGGSSDDDPGGS